MVVENGALHAAYSSCNDNAQLAITRAVRLVIEFRVDWIVPQPAAQSAVASFELSKRKVNTRLF